MGKAEKTQGRSDALSSMSKELSSIQFYSENKEWTIERTKKIYKCPFQGFGVK